jgi:5-methylcytosine-specific restriction endonuclease McrA
VAGAAGGGAASAGGGAEAVEGVPAGIGNGRGTAPDEAQAAEQAPRASAQIASQDDRSRPRITAIGIGASTTVPQTALTALLQGSCSVTSLTPRQASGKIQNDETAKVRFEMEQTLLLNASYEPLKIVNWQKAVTLWCQGKVEVISVYDREIRAVSLSFKLPSVIRLLRYIKIKRRFDYVPFSRANIYARDDHSCQYCGEDFSTNELTFDHVVPVAQGGRKDWENIVTCCVTCNRKKGGRTPAEAGMHLKRMPRRPERAPAIRITVGLRNAPESWRDYLYWNVELDDT